MVFKDFCILVLWTKVASALEGLPQATNKEGHEGTPREGAPGRGLARISSLFVVIIDPDAVNTWSAG